MLDTLDTRLAQARGGELGHLEFLQTLCHDEIGRRELTAMGRRLRRAHFDTETTLEEFDFHASPNCPPRRSVTSPRFAGCTPASR